MEYHIRLAEVSDLDRILTIYAGARLFMAENGNPNQWGTWNPPEWLLRDDIAKKQLYVMVSDDRIHGVFAFILGEDPTYKVIEGQWGSDTPYGTIHRIAGDGSGGILHVCVAYCSQTIGHLRIDTHKDNHVMQGAIRKEGFQYRGIIYIADGSPRLAYDMEPGRIGG